MGTPSDLDAAACVDVMVASITDEPSVAGSTPLEDGGEVVQGGTAADAFGAYTLALSDGGEQNIYLRCIVLDPGKSVLVIEHFWRDISYESAAARLEILLAGLELP